MTTLSGIITPTNLVTLTGTATLTNKTIAYGSNTLTDVVGVTATQTLTNKTLTAPTIASANLTTALTLAGAAGTAGQVITSAGGGLPTWSAANTGSFGTDFSYKDYFLTLSTPLFASISNPALQAVSLDGTSELLIIQGASTTHAVVYNTSTDTFGTPVLVRSVDLSSVSSVALAKISSTAVLVCSLVANTIALETVVLTISGSTITVGTALSTVLAAASQFIKPNTRLVTVGSSYVLNYYTPANGLPKFRAITVSGATPTIGAELAYAGGTKFSMHHSYAQSATTLLHFSMTASTTIFALPIIVTGTTLSTGTAATVSTTDPTFFNTGALSNSRYALFYLDSTGRGAVVSVTGGSVASISTAATTMTLSGFAPAMQVFNNQAFIVHQGGVAAINVITDTGGVATLGATTPSIIGNGSVIGFLSTGKVFFASSASGDSSYFQYGISSGAAVLEKSFQSVTSTYTLGADQIVQTNNGYVAPLAGLSQSASGNGVTLRTATGKVINGTSGLFPFTLSFDGTVQAKLQEVANPFSVYNDGISEAVGWGLPNVTSDSATTIQLRKVTLA